MFRGVKNIIVGAGLFGGIIAERIANDSRENVIVLDRRKYVGGNSASKTDPETGIEYHLHGTHVFHTKNRLVKSYISKHSRFNTYKHRVLTMHAGVLYPYPINLSTICRFYGRNLTCDEAKALLFSEARDALKGRMPKGFEGNALSKIGKPLYDAFIRGYSSKQWGCDLTSLPASIAERISIRFDQSDDFYDDQWQGLPLNGYATLFKNLLASKRIKVHLGIDFFDVYDQFEKDCCIVYSGPIDRFFGYKHGRLTWRSLDFNFAVVDKRSVQDSSVINFADTNVPYTRAHEFRHLHPERSYGTESSLICYEYAKACSTADEPYYPVRGTDDLKKLDKYNTETSENVIFGGRLGTYEYLNMDQVIEQALLIYEKRVKPLIFRRKTLNVL